MHSNSNCTFEATAVDPFAATYINSQRTYRCRSNLPRSLYLQPPQQAKTRAQSMPKPKPRDKSNINNKRNNAARRHNLNAIILVFPAMSSDTTHFIALLWQLLCHGLWPAVAAESGRGGESLLLPSLVVMTIFTSQGNWLKVAKTLSHRNWNRIDQGAIYTYILTLRVQRFMLSGCLMRLSEVLSKMSGLDKFDSPAKGGAGVVSASCGYKMLYGIV